MNVQRLILFTLGSTSLLSQAACTYCGNTDFKATDETRGVTKWAFEQAMETEGVDAEDVSCGAVCEASFGEIASVSLSGDCSMDIDYALLESGDTGEDVDSGGDYYAEIGTVTCSAEGQYYCEGRRPIGFQGKECEYFAKSAHLEACSVIAFQQLMRQLEKWNAPQEFIERAKKAAEDEVRHAAQMRMLAWVYNEPVPSIEVDEIDEDNLLVAAIHNAMEGCIFETWATVEAQLKSEFAETEEMRRVYKGIARDEMEHAQLSWDLHFWFMSQLSEEEQEVVRIAQKEAIAQLASTAVERFEKIPYILGFQNVKNREDIVKRFVQQLVFAEAA